MRLDAYRPLLVVRDSITKLLARYGLPLLGAALAVLLRVVLHPSYLDRAPFLLPFIVVLASAWFGGLGPGLLTTILGIVFATLYPVLGWIDIEPIGFEAALVRFGIGSTVLCFLIDRLHRGERRFKSEAERRQSQIAELAAIVENTDDAVIGTTLDGVITSWNAGAERLYGYTANEA